MGCIQHILYKITTKGLLVDYLTWMQYFYPPDLEVSFTVTFGPKKIELPLPHLQDIKLSLLKDKPELPNFLIELFNQVEDLQVTITASCWDIATVCHIISLKPKSALYTKTSTETVLNTKDVESIKEAIYLRLKWKRKELRVWNSINCSYENIIRILSILPEVESFVELPSLKTALAIAQDSDGNQYPFILKEYNAIFDFDSMKFDILSGFVGYGYNEYISKALNELYFDPWITAGCPNGIFLRDWTTVFPESKKIKLVDKVQIPELILEDPSYISVLEYLKTKEDFIIRDKIVRRHIFNHLNSNDSLEAKLTLDLTRNANELVAGCPYVVAYQWYPHQPGKTNGGVGDLILSDGYRTFYIVEIKWICQLSGKNNREKRRRAKLKVYEQAILYSQYFQQRFPQFNSSPVTHTNEMTCLYKRDDTGYSLCMSCANNITFGDE